MITTLCFILAVVCWGLGFLNVTLKANTPNWLCGGLMFAGLGLWIAPLF